MTGDEDAGRTAAQAAGLERYFRRATLDMVNRVIVALVVVGGIAVALASVASAPHRGRAMEAAALLSVSLALLWIFLLVMRYLGIRRRLADEPAVEVARLRAKPGRHQRRYFAGAAAGRAGSPRRGDERGPRRHPGRPLRGDRAASRASDPTPRPTGSTAPRTPKGGPSSRYPDCDRGWLLQLTDSPLRTFGLVYARAFGPRFSFVRTSSETRGEAVDFETPFRPLLSELGLDLYDVEMVAGDAQRHGHPARRRGPRGPDRANTPESSGSTRTTRSPGTSRWTSRARAWSANCARPPISPGRRRGRHPARAPRGPADAPTRGRRRRRRRDHRDPRRRRARARRRGASTTSSGPARSSSGAPKPSLRPRAGRAATSTKG